MKIYLVWREVAIDATSQVLGYCKTEEDAYKAIDNLRAGQDPTKVRYYFWVEEVELLTP